MLFIFCVLIIVQEAFLQEFNVYHTNADQLPTEFNQVMHSCLYYNVKDDILSYSMEYDMKRYDPNSHVFVHQVIPYCFRPVNISQDYLLSLSNSIANHLTFYQLRMMNVTTEQLYFWSIPINLAEQYQLYLNGNKSLADSMFYNCTQGWFGPLCQYSFGLKNKSLLFNDILQRTFELKQRYHDRMVEMSTIFSNLSCYIHLKCNRGGPLPACLDWREICDGKVDCIDRGSDEEYCENLETNECQENEYRCHNGQCIPQEYLWDMSYNPECLDRTDEASLVDYTAYCPYDPSFRCEDAMKRPENLLMDADIICGDGSSNTYTTPCVNKRDLILKKAMIQATSNVSSICRDTMACLTGIEDCEQRLDQLKYCPELFQYPGVPVLFGHVTFIYKNDLFINPHQSNILLPSYICYNVDLCSLPPRVTLNNYSDCWPLEYLARVFTTARYGISWGLLIREVKNIFHTCATVSGGFCHYDESLYTCGYTMKCISKHRLLDGIEDCLLKDDEEYLDSCALNHSQFRLACDEKCFSPLTIRNYVEHCSQEQDEQSPYIASGKNEISFQTTCDRFVEINPQILIKGINYTDESECDFWPCNNSYTRCNGIWNCLNGADEVDCPPSTCPPLRHICFYIPGSYKIGMCPKVERLRDTYLNCSDTPDQHACYKVDYYYTSPPLTLVNDRKIAQTDELCIEKPRCISRTDEQFCSPIGRMCVFDFQSVQKGTYSFVCSFDDSSKQKIIPFSTQNIPIYPIESTLNERKLSVREKRQSTGEIRELTRIWRCNRGLPINVQLENNTTEQQCICPPAYYGDRCQYQNQRVSVTLQARATSDWQTIFSIILTLIDDEELSMHSFEQVDYLPARDCQIKYNIYLLYSTRPKNISKNYSVRIDVYNKPSLVYIATWLFPVVFLFLPVSRMALQIVIPSERMKNCLLDCGLHGYCSKYQNAASDFCQCHPGWLGYQCQEQYNCSCAYDSLCIAPSNCLCLEEKFGPRCYLKRQSCKPDSCLNNGICVLPDARISHEQTTCLCPVGFSGSKCQIQHIEMRIRLSKVTIPSFILIHFIKAEEEQLFKPHSRVTIFKKIGIYEDSVVVYRDFPFHIAFAQLNSAYYLIVSKKRAITSGSVLTDINPSRKCLSINELFNTSFIELHLIRRIKYYHLPCQQRANLTCFYDDTQMCLCNLHLQADCFPFNHSMIYDCQGVNYCENEGRCFRDHPICPKTSGCFCPDCYHGSRCQFSSQGFSLSLDLILGYHILPHVELINQPLATQLSAVMTMIIVSIGLLSSFLSIITLRNKKLRDIGCGIYIFMSSITSLLIMIGLMFKFWFLVISQMMQIVDPSLLYSNCRSTDFLLRVFLISSDWFNACVTTERAVTVAKGAHFDKRKSRQAAKWMIISIISIAILTSIQDPLYRDLVKDEGEQRIWCVTNYSSFSQIFDSTMILFHSLFPFATNVLSTLTIIILAARNKSKTHLQEPIDKNQMAQYYQQLQKQFRQDLRKQFQQHKYLLISSCILILLALPRLIISWLSNCMKSVRDPWLFLVGYFLSFIPSALIFAIFILPSTVYRKEFVQAMKRIRQKFHRI